MFTSPNPQQYNSPDVVIAAECEEPHAISRIRFDRNASISFGLSRVIRLLCPSLPSSPSPVAAKIKINFKQFKRNFFQVI